MSSKITADEFFQVLRDGLPAAAALPLEVLSLEHGVAVLRQHAGADALRPGGTISGPALFGLADLAMYAAVMTAIGNVPLAVTTDATIHFLRMPKPGPLVARARLIKEGARLVVGDVTITDVNDAPIVHVVMSYSVPPR